MAVSSLGQKGKILKELKNWEMKLKNIEDFYGKKRIYF